MTWTDALVNVRLLLAYIIYQTFTDAPVPTMTGLVLMRGFILFKFIFGTYCSMIKQVSIKARILEQINFYQ